MQNKQDIITRLQNKIKMAQDRKKIAKVVYRVLENWGDKQINKRLETAIQIELDNVFGTTPTEHTIYTGKNYISKVYIAYNKSTSWNGQPRYTLEAYGQYYGDDGRLTIGTTYANDMQEIKQAFDWSNVHEIENYQKAIDQIDDILDMQSETIEKIKKYHSFLDSFDNAKYIIEELTTKINRVY